MVVNQATLRSIGVGFSTLFNRAFENTETTWEKVATKVTSDTKEQEYGWLGQFPQMREWIGSREVQKMLLHGYTIRNKTYESTIGVKREDIEDDNYGTYGHLVSGMGEAAAQHPDTLVWGLLMEGFTQRCYDGKPFFSDQHPVSKGVKASNVLQNALSPESYETARTMIMSQVGENGKSLKIIPDTLFVAPANESMGRKILECEFIAGTSNPLYHTASLEVIPDLAENPKQEKSDRSEPKNAENENGGKAANDSAENESVQAGASPANDENKSGGSFGEKNCEGPADASGKDEKQSDDAAAEKSGSEKEKGENADLRKTACREEKKESEQSEGIASAAKNPLSEEELEAAVFANENVRLKIIGDYLSSLKKNGAPLVRGGTGTLAAPPLKASTIEDAGGMALRFLQKNA